MKKLIVASLAASLFFISCSDNKTASAATTGSSSIDTIPQVANVSASDLANPGAQNSISDLGTLERLSNKFDFNNDPIMNLGAKIEQTAQNINTELSELVFENLDFYVETQLDNNNASFTISDSTLIKTLSTYLKNLGFDLQIKGLGTKISIANKNGTTSLALQSNNQVYASLNKDLLKESAVKDLKLTFSNAGKISINFDSSIIKNLFASKQNKNVKIEKEIEKAFKNISFENYRLAFTGGLSGNVEGTGGKGLGVFDVVLDGQITFVEIKKIQNILSEAEGDPDKLKELEKVLPIKKIDISAKIYDNNSSETLKILEIRNFSDLIDQFGSHIMSASQKSSYDRYDSYNEHNQYDYYGDSYNEYDRYDPYNDSYSDAYDVYDTDHSYSSY